MAKDVTPGRMIDMASDPERVRLKVVEGALAEGEVGYDTQERMARYFEECLTLVRKKSQGYGDAWRQQGYMGNAARIISKTARLKGLIWRDKPSLIPLTEETVDDTVTDMINLCVFFLINWRDGNRWGR